MQMYGAVYSKEFSCEGKKYVTRVTAVFRATGYIAAEMIADIDLGGRPGYKVEYVKHLGLASGFENGFVIDVCEEKQEIEPGSAKPKLEVV